jgi:hypothetical protein
MLLLKHRKEKMKRTILLTLLISAITVAQNETGSNLTVEEIFSVETAQELETALTDGYPMPWLAEILDDESIPEEDRYWLDCRVRALIAQEFHRFYNENGNPVEVEADQIRYGEAYWQEHFIIDPPGTLPVGERNPETNLWSESGFVYNRFGDQTGRLALLEPLMNLSRDGSIAVLVHGSLTQEPEFGAGYLYFLYNDGSYKMYPDRLFLYGHTLSSDGDYIVVRQQLVEDGDPVMLFNREGELIWTRYTTGSLSAGFNPEISSQSNYCLIASVDRETNSLTRYCQVISIPEGNEILVSTSETSSRLSCSPDGELFFCGQDYKSISNRATVWTIHEYQPSVILLKGQYCSNDGRLFASTFSIQHSTETYFEISSSDGKLLFEESINYQDVIRLSPNGSFAMTSPPEYGLIQIPFRVWQIGGDE